MIPTLYKADTQDFSTNGIASLVDALTVRVTEGLNGVYELYMEYPANGLWTAEIQDFRIIRAKPNDEDELHNFTIYDIVQDYEADRIFVYATTSTNKLGNNLVTSVTHGGTPQTIFNLMKNRLVEPTDMNFVSDITTVSSVEWIRRNPLNCIVGEEGSLVQIFGGEVKRTDDTIYLYSRRGRDKVMTVRQGRHVSGYRRSVSTNGIVTRILPYFTHFPEGSEDPVTVEGTIVNSPLVNNYPMRSIVPIDYSNDPDVTDLASLNNRAKSYFTVQNPDADKPKVNIEVNLTQVSESSEYSKFKKLEQVRLADTIDVWVPKFNVDVTVKVTELEYDSLLERTIKIKAGSPSGSFYDNVKNTYKQDISQIRKYVNGVENGLKNVIQASADGMNKIFRGYTEPPAGLAKVNDLWFKPNGSGEWTVYIFDGLDWQPIIYESMGAETRAAVEEALREAEEARRQAKLEAEQALADANAYADAEVERIDTELRSEISGAIDLAEQAKADAVTKANQALKDAKTYAEAEDARIKQEIGLEVDGAIALAEQAKADAVTKANQALKDAKAHAEAEDARIKQEIGLEVDGAIALAEQAKQDAVDKANQALEDAKAHADSEIALIESHFDDVIEGVESDVAAAKQTADNALYRINNEIADKFTSMEDDILAIETISNSAQTNAQTALNQSLDALGDASTAITNAQTALNRADTAIGSASNAVTLAGNAVSKADEVQVLATNLSGQVSGFETTLAGFNQTVNNYEGQVSGFRNDILGLESTVASYETELDEFGNTVSTYATEVSTMRNTVRGFESTVATYGNEVSNLAGEVVGYKNQVSTFNNTVSGFNSTVANYTTEVNEFGEEVESYATEVSTLTNTVSGFQSKVTKVEQDYAGISGTVANHSTSISNLNGQIALKANTTTVNTLAGRVTTAETGITANANDIKLKANTTTVNTLTGRVSTAETGITANANAIQLKASQSSVDALTGRVGTAETSISANATAIGLKANTTTVNALTGTVNTLSGRVDVTAGQISSKVWKTDIQSAVDDIEIGGRNLLKGTTDEWIEVSAPANTNQSMLNDFSKVPIEEIGLSVGEDFVAHIKVKNVNEPIRFRFEFWNSSSDRTSLYSKTIEPTNGIVQSEIKGVFLSGYSFLRFQFSPTGHTRAFNYSYSELKLEKGNKATDWTPAPEDATTLINHVETELTQKHDAITATVSSVDGRVATNKLNLDGLTTTVQGVRTDLTGTTTLLNTTRTTVSGHTSTIATLRTDVDGKATTTQFNTLNSTVNGTITRVGNAEGRLTTVETNVNGLQTTVASKASQTQVTQLATGLSTVVSQVDQISEWSRSYSVNTANPKELVDINGSRLSKSYSYEITLGIPNTGTVTNFMASLTSNSATSGWTLTIHERSGTSSNHPYLYLDSDGYPMVSLYSHTSYYTVVATVKKLASRSKTSLTMLSDNINLRVAKGDVVSQINLEAGRTLIQSDKLVLDSSSVVFTGSAFIPSAQIASIDAGKITAGTISTARLNTSAIVTAGLTANVIKSTHIETSTATIDKIFATDAMVNTLTAKTAFITSVKAVDIDASKITSGTISAARIDASDIVTKGLTANVVKSTHIETSTATVDKLFATEAMINQLTTKTAFITSIKAVDIDASKITSGTINAARINASAVVTAGLTANVVKSTHIETSTATVDKLFATDATVNQLTAKTAFINSIKAVTIDASKITSGTISSSRINASAVVTAGLTANVVKSTHLETSTATVDKLFATDAMVNRLTAKSAFIASIKAIEISADKITTGTLFGNSVTATGINVSTIVGNVSNFVTSNWNSNGSDVRITSGGILTTASDGSQTYIQNGIVGTRNPSGATVGQLGYIANGGSPTYTLGISQGSNFLIRGRPAGTDINLFEIYPGSSETYIRTNQTRILGEVYVNGRIWLQTTDDLRLAGGNIVNPYGIYFTNGGEIYSTASTSLWRFDHVNNGIMQFRIGGTQKFRIDATRNYMNQILNMQGNQIVETSDARLKTNIRPTTDDTLSKLKQIEYVDYQRLENGQEEQGFIAQQVRTVAPELIQEEPDGMLTYAIQPYIHFIGRATQQLASATESELTKLKNKLKELEDEINKLRNQ